MKKLALLPLIMISMSIIAINCNKDSRNSYENDNSNTFLDTPLPDWAGKWIFR